MKLGLHLIKYPTGRFGYVGSIPTSLATIVPATQSDVAGGRAFDNEAGDLVTYKFPSFSSAGDAVEFANAQGAELCESESCACRKLF